MSTSHRADETIPLFSIGDAYYFKYYFEDRELFGELSQYYNNEDYRFEVPSDEIDAVVQLLNENGKHPQRVTEPDSYVVVKKKYTNHPDVLFKKSVLKADTPGFNLFLMQDEPAVETAVTSGATPLGETNLSFDP